MSRFIHIDPSRDAYWRALILFGGNSASYKFALAQSLIEKAKTGVSSISLQDLALPYARRICDHLLVVDRQCTAKTRKFLDACRNFNSGDLSESDLVEETARIGFVNVIDAFHNLSGGAVECRFFDDDRKGSSQGLVLTEDLHTLVQELDETILDAEVQARWRLVETAWDLGIGQHMLADIGVDEEAEGLVIDHAGRRRSVTSVRDALNGYQKGQCFYCGRVLIWDDPKTPSAVEVDHVFPWVLSQSLNHVNLDGVWNLVLACHDCNAGPGGKFEDLPALDYLANLERRNNYLINSHHPLRDTLIRQTGRTEKERCIFLQDMSNEAVRALAVPSHARWRVPVRNRLRF